MPVVMTSSSGGDGPCDGRDRQDLVFAEGMLVDDDGTLIKTYAVHLGQATDFPWPQEMPVVVKGSAEGNAIERRGTIRLSKPEVYRNQGETLISDPGEGVTRREESTRTVDDPADLSHAAEVNDEMNRGAAAIGSIQRRTVESTTHRKSTKTQHTYGKNCWIWCAAVEPENDHQWDTWRKSLPDDYDCVTTIESPRAVARHLAMMVAQQIGPLGSIATYTHPLTKHQTEHPTVSVFHGPVAYVDDPHSYVSEAANGFEQMLRAVFFKHTTHVDQREYRFVVWSEQEPERVVVDLKATPEMLSLVSTRLLGSGDASPAQAEAGHSRPAEQDQGADQTQAASNGETGESVAGGPSEVSGQDRPSQPVQIFVSPGEVMRGAVTARFAAAIEVLRQLALEKGIPADLCAAAFHVEWTVMRLLLTFVDPIEGFTWTDGVLVVTFKMPHGSHTTAQMAIGPNGTAQYKITTDNGHEEVSCEDGFLIADTLSDDLARLGLLTCAQMATEGHVPPPPSIALQETERLNRRSTRSADVQRLTVRKVQNLNEAEIDAANAEVEPRPDDARITKLVVTSPGGTSKMHGIKAGLTGPYRQRVLSDHVTFRVETMNPGATVEIDPSGNGHAREGNTVAVPDGEDTVITITATSPDGTSQSQVNYIALRTAEDADQSV